MDTVTIGSPATFEYGSFSVTNSRQKLLTRACAGQLGTIWISNQTGGSVFIGDDNTLSGSGFEIPTGFVVAQPYYGNVWIIASGSVTVSYRAMGASTVAQSQPLPYT